MSEMSTAAPSTKTRKPARTFTFAGPWFSNAEAAAYVCCKSVKAFYEWKRRHGVVSRSNGSVCKRDLDLALRQPRKKNRMAPASLANLRKRSHAAQFRTAHSSTVTPEIGASR